VKERRKTKRRERDERYDEQNDDAADVKIKRAPATIVGIALPEHTNKTRTIQFLSPFV